MPRSSARRRPPTYPQRHTTVVRYRKGWNTMQDDTGDAAIVRHLRDCERRSLRPRTLTARHDLLVRLRQHAGKPLLSLAAEDIQAYIDAARQDATKRVYLAHARAFYSWAVDDDLLTRDPTRKVRGPKSRRGVPRPISEPDLRLALSTATPLLRAWMILGAYAGLRACEIAIVRGEDVVRDAATPYLYLPETKGGGDATVPLSTVVLDELAAWPQSGWLWQASGPVHYDVVSRKVNAHLRSLGIRAGLHALRHRFATQTLIANGHNLRETQELCRHASPVTTAIYTAIDPKGAAETVNLLPSPPPAAPAA